MTLTNTDGNNFVHHPCYEYPMVYRNNSYPSLCDALVATLAPAVYSATSDVWQRYEYLDRGAINLETPTAKQVLDELYEAKYITNEDDYLYYILCKYNEPITEILDIPKTFWGPMYNVHKKLLDNLHNHYTARSKVRND